jgi:hypothetical protein
MSHLIQFVRVNRSGLYYGVDWSLRNRQGRDVISRRELVAAVGKEEVARYEETPVYEVASVQAVLPNGIAHVTLGGTAGRQTIMSVDDLRRQRDGARRLDDYVREWWPLPAQNHDALRMP